MAEPKAGEHLAVTIEHVDTEGGLLGDVRVRWFGFDNATANAKTREVVGSLSVLTEEWTVEKLEGK